MPTKITVSGVSKKADNGDYREYDFSTTIDDNLTEQQVFDIVMKAVGGETLYRKSGQREDRIQVSYIGAQSEAPSLTFQPRDEKGHFKSYSSVGRELWEKAGRSGIDSKWTVPSIKEFEAYARIRGVNFATGTASASLKSGISELTAGVKDYFSSVSLKSPRPGSDWRKDSVQRTKSPYKQAYFEEE